MSSIVELGIQHEQQHQELMLTDVKHLFSLNPLLPTFREGMSSASGEQSNAAKWLSFDEGIYEIGSEVSSQEGNGFAFDNESPRHRVFLETFALASRPVTSGEFLDFVEQGGYSRPELWLSLGWHQVQQEGWKCPAYWFEHDGQWQEFTLAGLRSLDLEAPVTHISYFEADAFARWAESRLPTEAEWEVASASVPLVGNFVDLLLSDGRAIHPTRQQVDDAESAAVPTQMFGDVWEWTASPYAGYPGYRPAAGALGEYNGKFMCNQYVLRGGSVATSANHIRRTYRNFFSPESRWQFSGFRLAK